MNPKPHALLRRHLNRKRTRDDNKRTSKHYLHHNPKSSGVYITLWPSEANPPVNLLDPLVWTLFSGCLLVAMPRPCGTLPQSEDLPVQQPRSRDPFATWVPNFPPVRLHRLVQTRRWRDERARLLLRDCRDVRLRERRPHSAAAARCSCILRMHVLAELVQLRAERLPMFGFLLDILGVLLNLRYNFIATKLPRLTRWTKLYEKRIPYKGQPRSCNARRVQLWAHDNMQ